MNTDIAVVFFVVLVVSLVFSMFGKGGGVLYTPIFVMLGVEVNKAIAMALLLNLATSFVATVVFHRNNLIDYKFCLRFLPGTFVGSFCGAILSKVSPKELLLGIFVIFLYVAGALLIFSPEEEKNQPARAMSGKNTVVVMVFSFCVGLLSSLIGVGGGLAIFPFLVLYMGYNPQMAAGANSLIVMVSSFVGVIGHFTHTFLDVRFVSVSTIACILGAWAGSHITVYASPKFVKIAFGGIMWFFGTEILYKLLR